MLERPRTKVDKLLELMTASAAKLGMEASRVYPELIRLWWWQNLAESVATLLLVLTAVEVGRRCLKTAINANDDNVGNPAFVVAIISAIIALAGATGIIVNLSSWVAALAAPEASLLLQGAKSLLSK